MKYSKLFATLFNNSARDSKCCISFSTVEMYHTHDFTHIRKILFCNTWNNAELVLCNAIISLCIFSHYFYSNIFQNMRIRNIFGISIFPGHNNYMMHTNINLSECFLKCKKWTTHVTRKEQLIQTIRFIMHPL